MTTPQETYKICSFDGQKYNLIQSPIYFGHFARGRAAVIAKGETGRLIILVEPKG